MATNREARIELVAEGLISMDSAQLERYRDWVVEHYAMCVEGELKGGAKQKVEILAKRLSIIV